MFKRIYSWGDKGQVRPAGIIAQGGAKRNELWLPQGRDEGHTGQGSRRALPFPSVSALSSLPTPTLSLGDMGLEPRSVTGEDAGGCLWLPHLCRPLLVHQ